MFLPKLGHIIIPVLRINEPIQMTPVLDPLTQLGGHKVQTACDDRHSTQAFEWQLLRSVLGLLWFTFRSFF